MPRQTLSALKAAIVAGSYADDLYSDTRRRLEYGRWLYVTGKVSDYDVVLTDTQEAAIDRLVQRECPQFWPAHWFEGPQLLPPYHTPALQAIRLQRAYHVDISG